MSNKINIVTLGCAKNRVDSEHLAAQLTGAGFDVVHDSSSDTSTVIINTCGFIGDAKEESVNTILSYVAAKQTGIVRKVMVMGCLSQRYMGDLSTEIPEVDAYYGVEDIDKIVKDMGGSYNDDLSIRRVLSTPPHYAYLKISEGCNRACGFCIIPSIRGPHRSVEMERLICEAECLAQGGVKELMVIAQDTTCYGMDIYGRRALASLLEKLCAVQGIEWIRLHYAYPAQFPDDVIEVMRTQPKICKYLDIPLQHISDSQLSSMRRGICGQTTKELIEKLRSQIPGIALRTTMLVGYPGESEGDFKQLMDFVASAKFERLGVFPYSEEENTYSACNLADDVPQSVKESRAERLIELQSGIALDNNEKMVGQTVKVIIDRKEGDYYIGRTEHDSPEVDQEVLIKSPRRLRIGCFYNIIITSAMEYDLYGQITV